MREMSLARQVGRVRRHSRREYWSSGRFPFNDNLGDRFTPSRFLLNPNDCSRSQHSPRLRPVTLGEGVDVGPHAHGHEDGREEPDEAPVGVPRFHSMPRITTPNRGTMKKKISTWRNSRMLEK